MAFYPGVTHQWSFRKFRDYGSNLVSSLYCAGIRIAFAKTFKITEKSRSAMHAEHKPLELTPVKKLARHREECSRARLV